MSVVALASAKASPGVTTLALALTWCWPAPSSLLVEADADGGSVAVYRSLRYEPSLRELASVARHHLADEVLWAHIQELGATAGVLVAPPAAQQARASLAALGARLGERLAALGSTAVVLDTGRLTPGSPSMQLAQWAQLTLLVCRPDAAEVQHLASRAAELSAEGLTLGLVCRGRGPWPPEEAAGYVGLPLVGVVAEDRRGADMLRGAPGSDRLLRQSSLWASAARLAGDLASHVGSPSEPTWSEGAPDASTQWTDPTATPSWNGQAHHGASW